MNSTESIGLTAVFISYNQAYKDLLLGVMHKQMITGYTAWEEVHGRGSRDGEPHLGTHAWPTLNSALLTIIPSDKVSPLLQALRALDEATPKQGLRAFCWAVTESM